MKKIQILLLLVFSISYGISANFGSRIAIIGQFPQGELKNEGVPVGFGLDVDGLWYPVNKLALGFNLGWSEYGSSEREIPFGYYAPSVTVTEETKNEIVFGHFVIKIIPFRGVIRPYFEGLLGLKNLSTTTSIKNDDWDDDWDNEEIIASSENASDNALSYGIGSGLEITLTSLKDGDNIEMGSFSFFIGLKYLWGGEAEYLKEGSITFSDPEDGPVQSFFDWNNSETDLIQYNLGLHYNMR